MSYKTHLFVCTNSPDRPEKCGSKGSEIMRRRVKEKCSELYGKDVRVNASGCLGFCEKGIVAVAYPQGEWLFELNDKDDQKLLDLVSKEKSD